MKIESLKRANEVVKEIESLNREFTGFKEALAKNEGICIQSSFAGYMIPEDEKRTVFLEVMDKINKNIIAKQAELDLL